MAQLVKNLAAMQDTWVWSLGWDDPWRRERLPTPIFWPGEFHGLYSPWGRKESGMTEWFSLSHSWLWMLSSPKSAEWKLLKNQEKVMFQFHGYQEEEFSFGMKGQHFVLFMCTMGKEMAATPVFSPGKSHGQKSLAGYSHKESDTTKHTHICITEGVCVCARVHVHVCVCVYAK